MKSDEVKKRLIDKGVSILLPESVYISSEVDPELVSADQVILYPGTRITGSDTVIMKGAIVGEEGPVTIENCQVGENCRLKAGFFQHSVFVKDNQVGSGAHVRKGCILEEQSGAAHCVGLKQTLLFPFVILGSQINFCDCLMAGGTSRKNHSEVGSSFIHFNFTPNQDKATASLIGNVTKGVMLDQPPIFLGGQGGLVGPLRIGFGCVTAAGSIIRKDELRAGRLVFGGSFKDMSMPAKSGVYTQARRIFNNNIHYLSALVCLKAWYRHIRSLFVTDMPSRKLWEGMNRNLDFCFQERIRCLEAFAEKVVISRQILASAGSPGSSAINDHDRVISVCPAACRKIEDSFNEVQTQLSKLQEKFIKAVEQGINRHGKDYIKVIQGLDKPAVIDGVNWLQSIDDRVVDLTL